jgi:hypothetical protein
MSVLRDGDEVTDPGDHAADLLAIGQRIGVADLAQARARMVPRVFGLLAMVERICLTVISSRPSVSLFV